MSDRQAVLATGDAGFSGLPAALDRPDLRADVASICRLSPSVQMRSLREGLKDILGHKGILAPELVEVQS